MRYAYNSVLAPYIIGLIKQKRSDGFGYKEEEYHLKKIDEFCLLRFPDANTVTRELASEWSVIRPTEGRNYLRRRISMLKQLSIYILSLGLEAYVPRYVGSTDKPVLYIPSHEELTHFFRELDSSDGREVNGLCYASKYKIMFRLYYCCGLRLSEVRLLKAENVDLERGILTIKQSKGRKDRLVYLPPDGINVLANYWHNLEKVLPGALWLFPGESSSKPLAANTVRRAFIKCWNKLPFAANADKQPSIHCLRHAFVVERMNDWMNSGIELQKMLPYLSSYLGHASPSETFYYYHLVNKAFAIIKQKDRVSGRVIPEVMLYEEI